MWAQQIIISVIIATIIEMILPNGNNKKYIKTVLGVYILFTVISPVLTNNYKKDIKFDLSSYEKYIEDSESYKTLSKKFESANSENIESVYVVALKQDIKEKLKRKNYNVNSIDVDVNMNSDEQYGEIKNISLSVSKFDKDSKNDKEKNSISVNTISIDSKKDKTVNNNLNLSIEDKQDIVQLICSEYGVGMSNINII